MPDTFGPFDTVTWMQAGWYRDAWARTRSGVFGGPWATPDVGDLGLTVSGLTITMGLGRAHVRGAGYERTGTAFTYAVPANTNANPRVDRLVLRRDLVAKTVVPTVLQGTPAASPVEPALTQSDDPAVSSGQWDEPLFSWTTPANSGAPLTGIVDERHPSAPARYWGRLPRTGSGEAVDQTATPGAREGDSAYVVPWQCMAIATPDPASGTGLYWRQTSIPLVNATSPLATYCAGLVAAGQTVHNGFQVYDASLNRMFVSGGGNTVTSFSAAGGSPSGWQTNLTAAANWTVTGSFSYLGNGMARIYCDATRTTSAYTVTPTGDVTNVALASLPAGWEAESATPLVMAASGRGAWGAIGTNSTTITLAAVAPSATSTGNTTIAIGEMIELAGIYPLNNAAALTV